MSSGNYQLAIEHYTKAIQHEPKNQILYSNRSAAYASLGQYEKALEDANTTVQVKPDWSKVSSYSIIPATTLLPLVSICSSLKVFSLFVGIGLLSQGCCLGLFEEI